MDETADFLSTRQGDIFAYEQEREAVNKILGDHEKEVLSQYDNLLYRRNRVNLSMDGLLLSLIHILKNSRELKVPPGYLEGYELKFEGCRPGFVITSGAALLAHTVTRNLDVRGDVEPLVGRKTATSTGFGRDLTKGQICWVPGSVLRERATFMINEDGCWEQQS